MLPDEQLDGVEAQANAWTEACQPRGHDEEERRSIRTAYPHLAPTGTDRPRRGRDALRAGPQRQD